MCEAPMLNRTLTLRLLCNDAEAKGAHQNWLCLKSVGTVRRGNGAGVA